MLSNMFARFLPTIRPICYNQQHLVRLLSAQASPNNREKGVVKRFSKEKGFGFISKTSDGTDYFVHFKNINATGFRALEPGQEVEFIGTEGEKGLEAKDVNILSKIPTGRKSPFDDLSQGDSTSSRKNFGSSSRNRSSLFNFGGIDSSRSKSNQRVERSFKSDEDSFLNEKSTSSNEQTHELGSVKRWTAERGFGFIRRASTGQDIFCHVRSLENGIQALQPGQTVKYTVFKTEKGDEARDVTILEGENVKISIKDNPKPVILGEREKGTVKKWIATRGFGFIQRETDGTDIFVHVQSLQDGIQSLEEGQTVEFNLSKGEKGDSAQNVTVLNEQKNQDNSETNEKVSVSSNA